MRGVNFHKDILYSWVIAVTLSWTPTPPYTLYSSRITAKLTSIDVPLLKLAIHTVGILKAWPWEPGIRLLITPGELSLRIQLTPKMDISKRRWKFGLIMYFSLTYWQISPVDEEGFQLPCAIFLWFSLTGSATAKKKKINHSGTQNQWVGCGPNYGLTPQNKNHENFFWRAWRHFHKNLYPWEFPDSYMCTVAYYEASSLFTQ